MMGAVVRRGLGIIAVLFVTSFLIYSALYVAPGDPVDTLAGGRQLSAQARAALSHEYGLDKPFLERYAVWLGGVVHGDFGTSFVYQHQQVRALLIPRLGTTVLLVVMSALLIVFVGVIAGVVAGLNRGKLGSVVTSTAALGVAVPSFVAAVVLVGVFAVGLGWFPVFGSGSGFFDQVWHLSLPAVALAIANVAFIARISETAIAHEAGAEHVMTARARGLPSRQIVRRHVLRNASIPIITAAGLVTAYLVVGAAVVETAFGLDGLGSLLVEAVGRRDFAVVQAISLVVVVVFLVINLIVDLLYRRLDPRIGSGIA